MGDVFETACEQYGSRAIAIRFQQTLREPRTRSIGLPNQFSQQFPFNRSGVIGKPLVDDRTPDECGQVIGQSPHQGPCEVRVCDRRVCNGDQNFVVVKTCKSCCRNDIRQQLAKALSIPPGGRGNLEHVDGAY